MMILIAEGQIGWEELARQFPLVAIALGVSWYAFRHITKQQEDHLNDVRKQAEQALKILNDSHSRVEGI